MISLQQRVLSVAMVLAMVGGFTTPLAADTQPKPEKTTITFGIIPTPDYVPVELGIQKGFFKDEGLEVTARITPPAASIPALLGGSIDISGVNWISGLVAYNRGAALRVAAEADRGTPGYADIVVKSGSAITSLRDLIGKKMASPSPPPGNCDVPVRIAMRAIKADDTAVGFTDLPIPQMPSTLDQGGVDAVCLPEPLLSAVRASGKIRSIFDLFGGPRVGTPVAFYGVSAEFIQKYPNTFAALKRAIQRAERYCVDHPDEVRAILPSFNHITPEQAKAVVLPTYVTRPDPAAAERLAKDLAATGFISGTPKVPAIGGP